MRLVIVMEAPENPFVLEFVPAENLQINTPYYLTNPFRDNEEVTINNINKYVKKNSSEYYSLDTTLGVFGVIPGQKETEAFNKFYSKIYPKNVQRAILQVAQMTTPSITAGPGPWGLVRKYLGPPYSYPPPPPTPNSASGGYRATARDRKYLARLRAGKSIGFTMRASLKAKGLIPRANGSTRVSEKYRTKRNGTRRLRA